VAQSETCCLTGGRRQTHDQSAHPLDRRSCFKPAVPGDRLRPWVRVAATEDQMTGSLSTQGELEARTLEWRLVVAAQPRGRRVVGGNVPDAGHRADGRVSRFAPGSNSGSVDAQLPGPLGPSTGPPRCRRMCEVVVVVADTGPKTAMPRYLPVRLVRQSGLMV